MDLGLLAVIAYVYDLDPTPILGLILVLCGALFLALSWASLAKALGTVIYYETLCERGLFRRAARAEKKRTVPVLRSVQKRVRAVRRYWVFLSVIPQFGTIVAVMMWIPATGTLTADVTPIVIVVLLGLVSWHSWSAFERTVEESYTKGSQAWAEIEGGMAAHAAGATDWGDALAATPEVPKAVSRNLLKGAFVWARWSRKLAILQLKGLRSDIRRIGADGAILDSVIDYFLDRFHRDEIRRIKKYSLAHLLNDDQAEFVKRGMTTPLDVLRKHALGRLSHPESDDEVISHKEFLKSITYGAAIPSAVEGQVEATEQVGLTRYKFSTIDRRLRQIEKFEAGEEFERRRWNRSDLPKGLRSRYWGLRSWKPPSSTDKSADKRWAFVVHRQLDKSDAGYSGHAGRASWRQFEKFELGKRKKPHRHESHAEFKRRGKGERDVVAIQRRPVACRRPIRRWLGRLLFRCEVVFLDCRTARELARKKK